MEERGNPAGLRQAPRERRRKKRGRAAPKGDVLMSVWQPKPQVYIGGKGAAPPLRVSTPKRRRPALDPIKGGGQGEERERRPTRWALRPIWT